MKVRHRGVPTWVIALAIIATTLIGVASQVDIPGVSKILHPKKVIECQDSPACRAFVEREIRHAIAALKGGGHQNPGHNPSQRFGPGPGPHHHSQHVHPKPRPLEQLVRPVCNLLPNLCPRVG